MNMDVRRVFVDGLVANPGEWDQSARRRNSHLPLKSETRGYPLYDVTIGAVGFTNIVMRQILLVPQPAMAEVKLNRKEGNAMKNLLGFAAVTALFLVVPQFAFAAPAAGDIGDEATESFVLYWPTQASSVEIAVGHDSLRDGGAITVQNSEQTHDFSVDR